MIGAAARRLEGVPELGTSKHVILVVAGANYEIPTTADYC